MFLLTAFRRLVAERCLHDKIRPETDVLREILYNQISGFDINEATLRFAALGLYLLSIELDPQAFPLIVECKLIDVPGRKGADLP